ncbi:hypothetical protein ATO6_16390 [Oceanicola sp. 22II-s10i]|uniref:CerR family C-terminal domain-containing protein n=1 Tax=Oceanicola sp. 22II-s10i TaxID=1317116 RepID=UPI000B5224D8|nr:CerR family C-terminal domain-containing protein [Oceanicola sp. 22II-s10i]OWU83981.1 hypothetical protein ATO6_16390 [Oceanicola sp. 22II-s10i]
MTESPRSSTDTRTRLIEAALKLFGRDGYDGASTRAIAGQADTNVASIAYHFGGKEGLRDACIEALAARITEAWGDAGEAPRAATPETAARMLERILRGMASVMATAPEARDLVAFVVRDITGAGSMSDRFYAQVIEPRHKALCSLWAMATGQNAEADEVRLTVFAMVGQVLYFNVASPLVARRMGWSAIGPAEAGVIADTVVANLHAAIERHRV